MMRNVTPYLTWLLLLLLLPGCGGNRANEAAREELEKIQFQLMRRYDRDGFESLTQPERTILLVMQADQEIGRGDFLQFFANEWGGHTFDIAQALQKINAPEKAALVNAAVDLFPEPPISDKLERREQLLHLESQSGFTEQLRQLAKQWRRKTEDLDPLLLNYLNRHQQAILGGTATETEAGESL